MFLQTYSRYLLPTVDADLKHFRKSPSMVMSTNVFQLRTRTRILCMIKRGIKIQIFLDRPCGLWTVHLGPRTRTVWRVIAIPFILLPISTNLSSPKIFIDFHINALYSFFNGSSRYTYTTMINSNRMLI